ncbi:MAG TPA: hypothetical protein VLC28_00580, partial [Flavitalea sp.]|nr:hypothetical protein [Flavitalea sp.]
MKRFYLSICAMLIIVATQAQTADEVIRKHLDATGGADKWPTVKTLVIEAVAVAQNGQEITSKISKIQNKILRREVNMGMGTMKMVVTPDGGWFASPRNSGNFEPMPQGMQAEQSLELDINPLSDYAAKGYKVELAGKEQVDGKDGFKIKLTTSNGKERNYFIDAATYYLVKETFMSNRERMRGGNGANGGAPSAGPTEVTV